MFNAPDEPFHFEYVRFLATQGVLLDPTDPERRISTEGFNPPLYYGIAALALRGLSNDGAADVRLHQHRDVLAFVKDPAGGFPSRPHPRLNPRYLKWGKGRQQNMFRAAPRTGGVLALHWLRGLSVLMGALTVFFVWRAAEAAFPERRELPVLAGALCAFNPQFAFLSGSINNDNLVITLSSAAIYLTTRIVVGDREQPRWLVGLGLTLGLALLTKLNAAPIAAACLLAVLYQQRSVRAFVLVAVPTAAVSGWFYVRGLLLFGVSDPLGMRLRALQNPELEMADGETLRFFSEVFFQRLFTSSFGQFDWLTVRLPDTAYAAYGAIGIVALAGLVLFLRSQPSHRQRKALALWGGVFVLALLALVALNRTFLSAQGRLIFPAIAGTSALLAVGLGTAGRALMGEGRVAAVAGAGFVLALLGGSVWALVAVLHPVYYPG